MKNIKIECADFEGVKPKIAKLTFKNHQLRYQKTTENETKCHLLVTICDETQLWEPENYEKNRKRDGEREREQRKTGESKKE